MIPIEDRKIIFAIHDAHPWGGQDKYTLEIARWIAKKRKVELHAFSVQGADGFDFRPVVPVWKRPVLLKSLLFHWTTWRRFKKRPNALVNAMGACSIRSDIVQVLFVHRAWQERQRLRKEELHSGWVKKIYHSLLQQYDLFTERKSFRPEKKYIAISRSVQNEINAFFPNSHSISVVYPGIDPVQFRPISADGIQRNFTLRKELGVQENEVLFLFVGSFERKGLATVLRSLGKVQSKNWKLVVVGRGDIPRYQKIAKDFGIFERIQFMGMQKDVASYYQAANFFIFPTQYEPFGMVVLEAMACGAVPLVSQCAGAAELVVDQRNGMTIKNETDENEISGMIEKILENPSKFESMAIEARKTAEEYSWEKVADRYLSILDQVK